MKQRIISLGILLVVLASVATAQTWRGSQSVSVEVKDSKGPAVAEARVVFTFLGIPGETGPDVVATDSRGRAVLIDLAPGPWQVEIRHPDYLSYIAMLEIRRGKKPLVSASFLEAGGRSLTPVKVKFGKADGQQASPAVEARRPAEPVAAPPAEPAETTAPAEVASEEWIAKAEQPTPAEPDEEAPSPGPGSPAPTSAPVETALPEAALPETALPEPALPEAAPSSVEPEVVAPPAATAEVAPSEEEAAPVPQPEEVTSPAAVEPEGVPTAAPEPAPAAVPEPAPSVPGATAEETASTATGTSQPPESPEEAPTAVTEVPPAAAAAAASETPAVPPAPEATAAEIAEAPLAEPSPADQPATPEPSTLPDSSRPPAVEEDLPDPIEPPTAPAEVPAAEETPVVAPAPSAPAPQTEATDEPSTTPETSAEPATPVPATPAPTTPPAIATAALPPPADPGARIDSPRDGTCEDCESAEWTLQVSSPVPAADSDSPAGCGGDVLEAARIAMQGLSTSIQLELDGFIGPVGNGSAQDALRRVEPDLRAPFEGALAPYVEGNSPCQIVALVLPKAVRFSRLRIGAMDQERGGACAPGQTCPTGDSAWLGSARVERGPSATLVYGLFQNRSSERGMRAILMAYYRPPNANWRPRVPAGD